MVKNHGKFMLIISINKKLIKLFNYIYYSNKLIFRDYRNNI